MTARARRVATAGLALVALAGCGTPARDLWARYRAERMLWRSDRLVSAALIQSTTREGRTAVQAARALDAIIASFPPDEWVGAPAERPAARDVARLAGVAALERAALEERAGRDAEAVARYQVVARQWAGNDSIVVEAEAARARGLERLAHDDAAAAQWLDLAARPRVLTDDGRHVRPPVLAAPGEAVRLLAVLGRTAAADSVAARSAAAFAAAATALAGRPAGAELWWTVGDLRAREHDPEGARVALRRALADTTLGVRRAEVVLALAERAAEARLPDSAAAYAAWAARDFDTRTAARAALAEAGAWEAAGVADSAWAVYKQLVETLPVTEDLAGAARFGRALLLERMGRWESARPELRTLAMLQPTDPYGIEALVQIVRHHVTKGEQVLANIESRHALESLEQLLETQRDPEVLVRVHAAHAEILALIGRPAEAETELRRTWDDAAWQPVAARAGWRAARLADSVLSRPADAAALYHDLSARARDPEVRRLALATVSGRATPPAGTH